MKAILFDAIGTTIRENPSNTIINCFLDAFREAEILCDQSLVEANRGKDKVEMIQICLQRAGKPTDLATTIYTSFKKHFKKNISHFVTNEGALELFQLLNEKGIRIGIGTGLERDLFETIIHYLKWPMDKIDYIGIGPEQKRQRPHPDMIYDMMKKLNLTADGVLKIGDTVADIEEGRNANVRTAVILSGTQPKDTLLRSRPDFVIWNLKEVEGIIQN